MSAPVLLRGGGGCRRCARWPWWAPFLVGWWPRPRSWAAAAASSVRPHPPLTALARPRSELRAVVEPGLGQRVAHVILDGAHGEVQARRDRLVRHAPGHEARDLLLALAQPRRRRRARSAVSRTRAPRRRPRPAGCPPTHSRRASVAGRRPGGGPDALQPCPVEGRELASDAGSERGRGGRDPQARRPVPGGSRRPAWPTERDRQQRRVARRAQAARSPPGSGPSPRRRRPPPRRPCPRNVWHVPLAPAVVRPPRRWPGPPSSSGRPAAPLARHDVAAAQHGRASAPRRGGCPARGSGQALLQVRPAGVDVPAERLGQALEEAHPGRRAPARRARRSGRAPPPAPRRAATKSPSVLASWPAAIRASARSRSRAGQRSSSSRARRRPSAWAKRKKRSRVPATSAQARRTGPTPRPTPARRGRSPRRRRAR